MWVIAHLLCDITFQLGILRPFKEGWIRGWHANMILHCCGRHLIWTGRVDSRRQRRQWKVNKMRSRDFSRSPHAAIFLRCVKNLKSIPQSSIPQVTPQNFRPTCKKWCLQKFGIAEQSKIRTQNVNKNRATPERKVILACVQKHQNAISNLFHGGNPVRRQAHFPLDLFNFCGTWSWFRRSLFTFEPFLPNKKSITPTSFGQDFQTLRGFGGFVFGQSNQTYCKISLLSPKTFHFLEIFQLVTIFWTYLRNSLFAPLVAPVSTSPGGCNWLPNKSPRGGYGVIFGGVKIGTLSKSCKIMFF